MEYIKRTPAGSVLSPGRDLLNCSPTQFNNFEGDGAMTPSAGQLRQVLRRLDLSLKFTQSRLYVVVTSDGVPVSEPFISERETLRGWWEQTGHTQVREKRLQEQEWTNFAGPGRKAAGETLSERQAMRTMQYQKCYSVYLDVVSIIEETNAGAAPWTAFANRRDLLRHNINRPVGERRAMIEALSAYYDLYEFWPSFSKALDGEELNFDACQEEISSWVRRLGEEHNAPMLVAFTALNLALVQSKAPDRMIQKLRNSLKYNEIQDRAALRKLAEAALL